MHKLHRRFVLSVLRQARFWPALGYRVLAWRRFVRRLRRDPVQDLAVLRLRLRTDGGIPFYVWLTYRVVPSRRRAASLRPHRAYVPDDEEPESLYGIPPELRGLHFFAPEIG